MSEYIKDPSRPLGWKTVSHDKEKHKEGVAADAANLNPDAFTEDLDCDECQCGFLWIDWIRLYVTGLDMRFDSIVWMEMVWVVRTLHGAWLDGYVYYRVGIGQGIRIVIGDNIDACLYQLPKQQTVYIQAKYYCQDNGKDVDSHETPTYFLPRGDKWYV